MPTLYERIGGPKAVQAAVEVFYRKVLGDPRVSPFFAATDMSVQLMRQRAFLTMAFGGPNLYTGADLRTAHAGLVARGLSDVHFDAVGEHLASSLRELGVAEELVGEVLAIAEGARAHVLGRA